MNYSDFMALKSLADNLVAALDRNTAQGLKLMTAIDDLNAAVVALKSEVSVVETDVQEAVTKLASLAQQLADAIAANNAPAVKAASDDITAATGSLKTAADSLSAVVNPPAPTPAP